MKKLIFTYNANSGLFNSIKDTIQKTVAPNSYNCKLCQITFGAFSMNQEWKEFIDQLPFEIEFLHKDEFIKKHKNIKEDFPNVFISENNKLTLLISNKEINKAKSIQDLKDLVTNKIKNIK